MTRVAAHPSLLRGLAAVGALAAIHVVSVQLARSTWFGAHPGLVRDAIRARVA